MSNHSLFHLWKISRDEFRTRAFLPGRKFVNNSSFICEIFMNKFLPSCKILVAVPLTPSSSVSVRGLVERAPPGRQVNASCAPAAELGRMSNFVELHNRQLRPTACYISQTWQLQQLRSLFRSQKINNSFIKNA